MSAHLNRRVLVVDDMESIHDDFRKILGARTATPGLDAIEAALGVRSATGHGGFEVASAYQGEEAVAMAEAAVVSGRPFGVAFVDMRMPPGWDGEQTIKQLWQVDPELQVVICTAYSDHAWSEVIARLDVRDRLLVLKKPFDMVEVGQLAHTLAAKWQSTRLAAMQIAELARSVELLEAREAQLRAANAALAGVMQSLAHDLGAPLIAMRSFSQLLAAELDDQVTGKALHYLSRIQANSTVTAQMIDGLLRLDRVACAPLRVEAVELGAVVNGAAAELRGQHRQRSVALTVEEDLWVQADRSLLGIALHQLLDNAWKFSAQNAAARIEVGSRRGPDAQPVYFVADNGDGFDMSYADKLFRPFQKLHTDSSVGGHGVGLATVSCIVARHGGRVWAESQPGRGATFLFTLPAAGLDQGAAAG